MSDGYSGGGHERLNGMIVRAIEETKDSPAASCLTSSKGKTRFMIRAALQQGWLPCFAQAIRTWPNVHLMYDKDALVLQYPTSDSKTETLLDIVISLTNQHNFQLNLMNRAFLDATWDLPTIRRYELVPVTDLGLMIGIVNGYIIVTKVKSLSVAGEDHKVTSNFCFLLFLDIFNFILLKENFVCSRKGSKGGRPLDFVFFKDQ